MKIKRAFSVFYCILFFGICLALGLGAFFLSADSVSEGRDLAPFPALLVEGKPNTAFFTEFDAWLTDRFAGRQSFIVLNGAIRETVFKTGSNQVIVGEDGFLFYSETVADYTGENLLSDNDAQAAADAVLALSEYASSHGTKLILVIAPNKNTIYPDRMPLAYRSVQNTGKTNQDLLYEALTQRGVLYADLRTVLTGEKPLLYHKRDTHWNSAGALAAYDEILRVLDVPHENYSSCALVESNDFPGDLDDMLFPGEGRTDSNFAPDFDFSQTYIYTNAATSPMDMVIETKSLGSGSCLVFRDSFGSALIPYLSTTFETVRYERAIPYRIDILERTSFDYVIVEIAERNISQLISAAERILKSE